MIFLVIENFKNGDAVRIYQRFRDYGRLAPEVLKYISSWVTTDITRCYQIMECDDRRLLEEWVAEWSDLVDFEIIPVITSAEAAEQMAPKL